MTPSRLLALLPTDGFSVGTDGMPTAALSKLYPEAPAMLAELEREGRARKLTGGGWVSTRPWPKFR